MRGQWAAVWIIRCQQLVLRRQKKTPGWICLEKANNGPAFAIVDCFWGQENVGAAQDCLCPTEIGRTRCGCFPDRPFDAINFDRWSKGCPQVVNREALEINREHWIKSVHTHVGDTFHVRFAEVSASSLVDDNYIIDIYFFKYFTWYYTILAGLSNNAQGVQLFNLVGPRGMLWNYTIDKATRLWRAHTVNHSIYMTCDSIEACTDLYK